eukprot:scaffold31110_cov148-Skeletonema_menzelii.AAC.4
MAILTTPRPKRRQSQPDRQADDIRSRLLYKLGIYTPKLINASISQKIQEQKQLHPILLSQYSSLRAEITSSIRYVEPLKFAGQGKMMTSHHHDEQSDGSLTASTTSYSSSSSSSDVGGSNHEANEPLSRSIQDPPTSLISRLVLGPDPNLKRRRSVHFNNEVSVVPIPSRTSYTPYTRSRLFIGKKEMIRNAQRNEREFFYEGFDWRNAVEEDQMYSSLQMDAGELVHPANYVCSSSS